MSVNMLYRSEFIILFTRTRMSDNATPSSAAAAHGYKATAGYSRSGVVHHVCALTSLLRNHAPPPQTRTHADACCRYHSLHPFLPSRPRHIVRLTTYSDGMSTRNPLGAWPLCLPSSACLQLKTVRASHDGSASEWYHAGVIAVDTQNVMSYDPRPSTVCSCELK